MSNWESKDKAANNRETFLETLLSEIQYKKIRPQIAEEYNNHIDELAKELAHTYGDTDAALNEALKRMGNPVEIGKQLNDCHKPVIEWPILILTLVISAIGFAVVFTIKCALQYESPFLTPYTFLTMIILGLMALIGGIFVDYTKLEKLSLPIYACAVAVLCYALVSPEGNARFIYIPLLGRLTTTFNTIAPLLFISFSGLIKKYLTRSRRGLNIDLHLNNYHHEWSLLNLNSIKLIAVAILPLILLCLLPDFSTMVTFAIIQLCMVIVAINHKGFKGNKRKVIIGIVVFIGLFTILLFATNMNTLFINRIIARLAAFFNPQNVDGYTIHTIREFVKSSKPFGQATLNSQTIIGYLPTVHTDFIFTYIIASFGWVPALIIILLFALLIGRMVIISQRVKDYYGRILAIGICAAFSFQIIMNILICTGLAPAVSTALPFVSYGGTAFVGNMLLMGLFIGIYRRKDIIVGEKKPNDKRVVKFKFYLE